MSALLALILAMAMQDPVVQPVPPVQPPAVQPQPPTEAETRFAASLDAASKLLHTDVAAAVDALDHLAS